MLDVMTANRDRRIWAVAARRRDLEGRRRGHAAVDRREDEPARRPRRSSRRGGVAERDDVRTRAEGRALRLGEGVPRAGQARADGVRHARAGCGWRLEELSALAAEDADGRQAADPRGHERRRQGRQAHGVRRRSATTRPASSSTTAACIVAQQPNLVFLKDTNGDDRYDAKEILLHGFDSADTHHAINSFTFDPGGALYMQEGIFHRTQVESPWGPVTRQADGGVYRFEPRTWKFETYVPDELPESARARLRSLGPRHRLRRDRRPAVLRAVVLDEEVLPGDGDEQGAEAGQRAHAPGRRRGDSVEPPLSRGDAGQPDRAQHDRLPGVAELQAERGRRRASRSAEVDPILQSADENFRPVDAEVGPDGALYFVDWHNPIIGHMQHNLRDTSRDQLHGRVYRVTCPGRPLLTPVADRRRSRFRSCSTCSRSRRTASATARRSSSARATRRKCWRRCRRGSDRLDPKDPQLRASHDGGALGAPVAQPRQREAARADAAVERSVGARGRDARAVLLARSRGESARAAEDAGHRRASRPCGSRPCAPRASSRRRKPPRSRWRRSTTRRIAF